MSVGFTFMTVPVRVSRFTAWLNRGTPGELMPYNQPERVAQSRRMKWEYRVAGIIMAALGALFLAGEFGL